MVEGERRERISKDTEETLEKVMLLGGGKSTTANSTQQAEVHIRGSNCTVLPASQELKYAMSFTENAGVFYGESHVCVYGKQRNGRPTVMAMEKTSKQIEYIEQPVFYWQAELSKKKN